MKVSTENDNNFGYEKITILVENMPLRYAERSLKYAHQSLKYAEQSLKYADQSLNDRSYFND
jgi:hypothetical protein